MAGINLAYNNDTREVEMRLDFYFDNTPTSITKDNYLVEVNILEETGSGDNWVLGDISSNELSVKLINEKGMFTPTDIRSDFHGKIRSGMKIIPYIRVNKGGWSQMGVYYVDEWTAGVTGSFADIVAYDKLYKVFDSKPVELPVFWGNSRQVMYEAIFNKMGLSANYDTGSSEQLPYGYMLGSNSETLQKLTQSTMSICSCDRRGNIFVKQITGNEPVVATLKDSDQIITIDAEHNIQSRYDGAMVTYNQPTQSRDVELFSATDININAGRQELGEYQFSQPAVTSIKSVEVELGSSERINITDIVGHSKGVLLITNNPEKIEVLGLSITGKHLNENKVSIGEDTPNVIEIDNEFIQDPLTANNLRSILIRATRTDIYEISVDIRGNPSINIGDKVRIYSPLFNLDFEGIVKSAEYTYDGGLTGKMNVVNANLVGEV